MKRGQRTHVSVRSAALNGRAIVVVCLGQAPAQYSVYCMCGPIGSGSMRRHVLCGPLSSPSIASRWGSFVVVYIFSEFVQQYPCLPSCTLYKHILKSLYKNTY